jgi:membrane-bound inhibitor of C-type lysozyme
MRKILCVALVWAFLTVSAWASDNNMRLNDEVFIISGETVKVLLRTPAASGEKYEAIDGSDTLFWSKGDEASLTIDEKELTKYVLVRAFLSGEPDELFLTVDGKNYIMKETSSASGAKYEALDDPKTNLWSKGALVTLTVGGVVYPDYDVWQPLGRIWLPPSCSPIVEQEVLTPYDLRKAVSDDLDAARARYLNETVQIKGTVGSTGMSRYMTPNVVLTDRGAEIICVLPYVGIAYWNRNAQLSDFEIGQTVTMSGRVHGMSERAVVFKECEVVE